MKISCVTAALLLALGAAGCTPQTPAGTEPARIVADYSSGKVTLMGSVPNTAARDRLLDRARQIYGQSHVQDQIGVDAKVIDAPWIRTDLLFLPLVDKGISEGQSAFDGKRLILTGEVPSQIIRAQISERAAKAAGSGIGVENHLQVSP
jgi:osmotically-inducible protein OsmY